GIQPLQSTLPEGEQVYFSAPLHFPPYDGGDQEPGDNEEQLHEYHGAGEPGQLHVGEQYTEGHPAPHTVQSWVIADLIPVHLILSCSDFCVPITRCRRGLWSAAGIASRWFAGDDELALRHCLVQCLLDARAVAHGEQGFPGASPVLQQGMPG